MHQGSFLYRMTLKSPNPFVTKLLSCRHLLPKLIPKTSLPFFPPKSFQKFLQKPCLNPSNPIMAPKTSFGKRLPKESTRERRIKAREENLASSSAPSSSIVLPGFAKKVIAKGRCLTLDFLEREGFHFGDRLKNLGLEPFCSLNRPIYPNLIKKFLSVAVHFKSGFKGNLRGTEVVVTSTSVSDFLNIPR